ncbi:right-handed parallel beta-helix repeat-containing protein [Candidatus Fermentibacteria bacterium]|nr:right-handed parallel beta-helix repeat-containing protein [Candidatus Fermentibacteria bacterium]
MGELSFLSRPLVGCFFAVLPVFSGMTPAAAQPASVSFAGLDSLRIWPGQDITISVEVGGASEGTCTVSNLSSGDSVTRGFSTADSVALIVLPFGPGWTVGSGVSADTLLQASYGHLIAASVEGVSDTARIGIEAARIVVAPEDAAVGAVLTISLEDRDQDLDTTLPDTISVTWSSLLAQREGQIILEESGPSTGVFSASVSVACVLDEDPPGDAVLVIDADTLSFMFRDSLAAWVGWDPPYGLDIARFQPVTTRTATLSVIHPDYGDVVFLPLDGDSLEVCVAEPDLAGVGELDARAFIRTPEGIMADSTQLELVETSDGTFSGSVLLGAIGGGLDALSGDSLLVTYLDRANDLGLSGAETVSALVGAVVVSGAILDTLWLPGVPLVLADTVTVESGHHLRVAPGCIVGALPNRSVVWHVDGTLELGEAEEDSVWVKSAARERRRGDWLGFAIAGTLEARVASIADAVTGTAVMPGASVDLEGVRFSNCGLASGGELAVWKQARRGDQDIAHFARQARSVPGAISATDAHVEVRQGVIEENGGFGVFTDGGDCALSNSTIRANAMDGLLAIGGTCRVDSGRITGNGEGGIYVVQGDLAMMNASASWNDLQGVYAVGGIMELSGAELLGNRGGGLMVRDANQSMVVATLISKNHGSGIDEAWDCRLGMESSTVAGNGGDGLAVNYHSGFTISASTLAFNRRYSVNVGPWCTVSDTLDARQCWWGVAIPPLDSTGVNNGLIYDGVDSPGRAVVDFSSWRTTPPPPPAPGELVPAGGEVLTFVGGGGGPGDTLALELSPSGEAPARYAAVAVASSLDTLVCLLLSTESVGGGPLRGQIVLSATADLTAPDQLAAATADQIRAWWVADSTVTADLTLPAVHPEEIPSDMRLEVYPNPFSTSLELAWRAPSPGVEVAVLDMAGRRLWHRRNLESIGRITLGGECTRPWPQGVYVVVVRNVDRRQCARVILIRG